MEETISMPKTGRHPPGEAAVIATYCKTVGRWANRSKMMRHIVRASVRPIPTGRNAWDDSASGLV